ncbi:hypothetical protein EXIGLDRAFT_724746 [Exidia glandulosa HHB12029]|uniref:Uncharacterized protein n=1 Tax=Exidia glandulosa HHB12029 TaxID=1314781 RepID=A0A165ZX99_EXIGL|nr:hypothetical protein EXIGLDRAFT_724746 [Exidia glandulosa HHB12029]
MAADDCVSPPTVADVVASVSPRTDAAECWEAVHNWDNLQARQGAQRMSIEFKAYGPPWARRHICTLGIPGIGKFTGNGRTKIAAKQDAAVAAYKSVMD